jgi:hypothetical protein
MCAYMQSMFACMQIHRLCTCVQPRKHTLACIYIGVYMGWEDCICMHVYTAALCMCVRVYLMCMHESTLGFARYSLCIFLYMYMYYVYLQEFLKHASNIYTRYGQVEAAAVHVYI